jgi:hypothetical protein
MNNLKRSAKFLTTARGALLATVFILNAAATFAVLGQNPLRVHTQPANAIRVNSAVLNGMILPGSNPATAWFEWGTSTQYGNVAGVTNVSSGNGVIALRHALNGLSQDYVYHCRLVGSNAAGIVYGASQVFTLGANVVVWGNPGFGQTTVPVDLTNAVAIGGGGYHCVALKNDGTIAAWGGNEHGQTEVPSDLTEVIAIAVGQVHNLALLADGTVRAWGTGTTLDTAWPHGGQSMVPPGLSDVVQIAAGTTHSLALKADGTVAAWGGAWMNGVSWDELGQTVVPSDLSNVVTISGGDFHSMALQADETIIVWGYDTLGQGSVPSGLSNVVAIAAGWYHNLALKSDRTLVAWGFDGSGAVTGLPPGLDTVASMAGGGFFSLAFGADGTAWGWGGNIAGESDIPPSLQNTVVAMAAGFDFSMALQSSAPIEVALRLEPLGDQWQLIWFGGVLQSANDVDGPFDDMPGVTSPLVFTPTEEQQFYRLKVQP